MKKAITTIILLSSLSLFCLPVAAAAVALEPSDGAECMNTGAEAVIKVTGQSVRVQNAQGKTLEVYSVTGAKVLSVAIDTNDKTVSLGLRNKGIYLIKVDEVTKKIVLR